MPALQKLADEGFSLNTENERPRGLGFGNGKYWIPEEKVARIYTYAEPFTTSAFVSRSGANLHASGCVFWDDLIFLCDYSDRRAYAYGTTGTRNTAREGVLNAQNTFPNGITHGDGHFWVGDASRGIFKYTESWGYVSTLAIPGLSIRGLTFGKGFLWALTSTRVYQLETNGTIVAIYSLDPDNDDPEAILYHDDKLLVVDATDDNVVVYSIPTEYHKITTLDSSSFKVWDDGVLIGTYPTHNTGESKLTKHDNKWFTLYNSESIVEYDIDFNYIQSHDISSIGIGLNGLTSFGRFLLVHSGFSVFFTKNGVLESTTRTGSFSGTIGGTITYDETSIFYSVGINYLISSVLIYRDTTYEHSGRALRFRPPGTIKGISVARDTLYIIYTPRLIKTFSKINGSFTGDLYTLGTSGEFNDLYVEVVTIPQVILLPTTSTLGIKPTTSLTPLKIIPAKTTGLRIVTSAPGTDVFGDTRLGEFIRTYNSNGDNETGITKYQGKWYTCDNADDSIRRYEYEDFSYIGKVEPTEIVVPVGMTTFRGYLVVLNRRGSTFRVQFYQGIGVFRFQSAGLPGSDYRAIAADSDFLYLYNNGANRIERIPVTLTTNSATLGSPTNWSIADTAIRGMRVLGDSMYTINTRRCLLYTSPSPRDRQKSRMPSSA